MRIGNTSTLISATVLAVALTACGEDYSNGERIGVVIKLSQKGYAFKSWEGEMLLALPITVAGTTQPEKFAFNVSPGAVGGVQDALSSGKRVALVYRQWAIAPLTIDHGHVVVSVRRVE